MTNYLNLISNISNIQIRYILAGLCAPALAMTANTKILVAGNPQTETITEIHYRLTALPVPVRKMREAILSAAKSGDIDALRPVLEMNELKVTVSFGGADDPISFWKQSSADGKGLEILAVLSEILEAGYAKMTRSKNEVMYVWPYFAEIPLDNLTPAQEVELYRLVKPDAVKTMKEFGAYIDYRLGIGEDGTWHFFVAGD